MSGPVYSNTVRNYEDLNKMSDNEFERYVEKELGLISVDSTYNEKGYSFRKLKSGDILIARNGINFKINFEDLDVVAEILKSIANKRISFCNFSEND